MANDIKFGTDGFRGIIAREFTYCNIEKITHAIVKYLKDIGQDGSTVLVGYDPRFMADKFAKFSADILENCGFQAYLSSKICPTPVLAYTTTITPNCGGAIMFTASHNPYEYLGMKFIPSYGGPATVEITDSIVKNLEAKNPAKSGGNISLKDFSEEYFRHIEKLIDFKSIAKAGLNILYDGLFSASIGYFDELLKRNKVVFESVNTYYDPLFGGGLPEPVKKYMKNSKAGFVTLSNDGDADRYGVLDEEGNWVSPNIIMALLLKYLAERDGETASCEHKGKLIKTVGASRLLDICAEKLGIETITTPVGFKWVGEAMRKHCAILAGEDSGGLSVGPHIPEKDGVFANALILEMLANSNKTLVELQKELKNFVGIEFITDRVDAKLDDMSKTKDIIEKILLLKKFAGFKITEKLQIDGVKLFLADNISWVLIRASGTEPLLRFYIESDSSAKIAQIKEFIANQI